VGLSYFVGGLVPLFPYFFIQETTLALGVSVGITLLALLIFGYIKSVVIGMRRSLALWKAVQTMFVGAVAAAVAFGVTKAIPMSE
jgi:VIT1/CCC1 family predicted Fe2+/Mn2+ transporter